MAEKTVAKAIGGRNPRFENNPLFRAALFHADRGMVEVKGVSLKKLGSSIREYTFFEGSWLFARFARIARFLDLVMGAGCN